MKFINNSIRFILLAVSGLTSSLSSMGPRGGVYPMIGIAAEATPFDPEYRVLVTSQALTSDTSKRFLSHNLIRRGVVPIQIDIQNNTANAYSVCASSVDLPHIDPKKIAAQVAKEAIPRLLGWRILGFLFWPLMIPGTIDSVYSYSHARGLKRDYHAKSLKEEGEVIAPYSTYHRILFVSQDEVVNQFDVTIIDIETLIPTTIQTELPS